MVLATWRGYWRSNSRRTPRPTHGLNFVESVSRPPIEPSPPSTKSTRAQLKSAQTRRTVVCCALCVLALCADCPHRSAISTSTSAGGLTISAVPSLLPFVPLRLRATVFEVLLTIPRVGWRILGNAGVRRPNRRASRTPIATQRVAAAVTVTMIATPAVSGPEEPIRCSEA